MENIIDDFTEKDQVITEMNLWNYKEQKTLIGVVQEIGKGPYGPKVDLSIAEGADLVTIPNLTSLNEFIDSLKVGNKIKLVYLGSQRSKSTNRDFEAFEMYKKE